MSDSSGKELIDLLLTEGANYNKYWITEGLSDFGNKTQYLEGFYAALKIVKEYFEGNTNETTC